jgi:hypothetical protein
MAGTIVLDAITDGTGNTVSGSTVVKGTAKAWVNFNGTGTVAIRSSFNVSSITDNGTGEYRINFTNPMPDTNYVYTGSTAWTTGQPSAIVGSGTTDGSITTSSLRIYALGNSSDGLVDVSTCMVAIFSS